MAHPVTATGRAAVTGRAMQPAPQLESVLRLAFDARDPAHPSGISLASYFVRAPTRGRRRSELERELLFPAALEIDERAVGIALDPASWRSCAAPRPTVPVATREWLAEAALALGRAEGFPAMWSLLRATSELEALAQRLLGPRTPRAIIRQVLHGVDARTLRAEPFAAFVVRVLKFAQGETTLSPEMTGLCFFVLLTQTASERRSRGGPSGGLSPAFEDAGFAAAEWLPDRTDDLAIRLLTAAGMASPEMLEALLQLVRATLSSRSGDERIERARERLPELLRWLEENGRELLERT